MSFTKSTDALERDCPKLHPLYLPFLVPLAPIPALSVSLVSNDIVSSFSFERCLSSRSFCRNVSVLRSDPACARAGLGAVTAAVLFSPPHAASYQDTPFTPGSKPLLPPGESVHVAVYVAQPVSVTTFNVASLCPFRALYFVSEMISKQLGRQCS